MDIFYTLNGITFIWNEQKAQNNLFKHEGVSFQQAAEAFFDPFLIVVEASRNDEIRYGVIGFDKNWSLLFVVHIQREDDMIRIISARKATRKERELYEV